MKLQKVKEIIAFTIIVAIPSSFFYTFQQSNITVDSQLRADSSKQQYKGRIS